MNAITGTDWQEAADIIGCEVAAVRAVADVEAPGGGYLDDGQVKILYEAHIFHRLTGGRYRQTHPDLSVPRWGMLRYGSFQKQHDRLAEAVKLDREAALQSCSWGRFQIMGFNYRRAGYESVQAMVNGMIDGGEAEHLRAFVAYIRSVGLGDELRRRDWHGFALTYNGPGYWKNHYAERIAAAYQKYAETP